MFSPTSVWGMKEGVRARDRVDFNNDEYYMRYEELMREGCNFFGRTVHGHACNKN
jgi:hypothetical protein